MFYRGQHLLEWHVDNIYVFSRSYTYQTLYQKFLDGHQKHFVQNELFCFQGKFIFVTFKILICIPFYCDICIILLKLFRNVKLFRHNHFFRDFSGHFNIYFFVYCISISLKLLVVNIKVLLNEILRNIDEIKRMGALP